jgi:WD40 repeat protein
MAPVRSSTPDGTRIITASCDMTARLWDVATTKEIAVLRGHKNNVFDAAFSPDGTRIVTASGDNTARIWDVATATQIRVLPGHEDVVSSAAFSPDGALIVTASRSGDKTVAHDPSTAQLWDVATGIRIAVLRRHTGVVSSAVFSPDGTRIITAWGDTARLSDVASGREIAVLRHETSVNSVALSPDGTRIVAALWNETPQLWAIGTVPKGNLFAIACANLPDHDLGGLATEYGFTSLEPICEGTPPLPHRLPQ